MVRSALSVEVEVPSGSWTVTLTESFHAGCAGAAAEKAWWLGLGQPQVIVATCGCGARVAWEVDHEAVAELGRVLTVEEAAELVGS